MLNSRTNGCRRVRRPLKRLLDEDKTGLSGPNSWWMTMIMMMSNDGLHKTQSMQARDPTPCHHYRAPCDAQVFCKHKIGTSRWVVFTTVLMKILVFWDRTSQWLITVDNYVPADLASNSRRLKLSSKLSFGYKSHNTTEK
jgi:hypothetical protein